MIGTVQMACELRNKLIYLGGISGVVTGEIKIRLKNIVTASIALFIYANHFEIRNVFNSVWVVSCAAAAAAAHRNPDAYLYAVSVHQNGITAANVARRHYVCQQVVGEKVAAAARLVPARNSGKLKADICRRIKFGEILTGADL